MNTFKKFTGGKTGFSLVEVLVAMGMAAVVSLAVMRINQSGMKGASAISSKIGLKMWQATVLFRFLSKEDVCAANFGGIIPAAGTRNDLVRADGTPFASAGQVIDGSSGSWRLATNNAVEIAAFVPDGGANVTTGSCDLTIHLENMKDNYAVDSLNLHVPMRCTVDSSQTTFVACAMSTDGSDSLWSQQLANGLTPEGYIHHDGHVFIGPANRALTAPFQVGIQDGTEWPAAGSGLNPAVRIEGDDHALIFDEVGMWETGSCLWFGMNDGGLGQNHAFCRSAMILNSEGASAWANFAGFGLNSSAISAANNPVVSGTLSVSMGNQNNITGNQSLASGSGNTVGANNSLAMGSLNTVTGNNSFAIGDSNTISGANSIVAGGGVFAGVNTVAGSNSIGVGSSINIQATSANSGAFGDQLQISGINNLATGTVNNIQAHNSFVAGNGNNIGTLATNSIAIGGMNTISANTLNAAVFGNNNTVSGINAASFGLSNSAGGAQGFSIGNNTTASGVNSFVQGTGTTASGHSSVAMGVDSTAAGQTSMALGGEANSGPGEFVARFDNGFKLDTGTGPLSAETQITFITAGNDVGIGKNPTSIAPGVRPKLFVNGSTTLDGERIAIGKYAQATHAQSVAISPSMAGRPAVASGASSVAIGTNSLASGTRAIALGANNAGSPTTASGTGAFAVGHNAIAGGNSSMAIGTNLSVGHANTVMLGSSDWSTFNSDAASKTIIVAEGEIEVCSHITGNSCSHRIYFNDSQNDWIIPSDKKLKENFTEVDGNDILRRLLELDVTSWRYKIGPKNRPYSIGPVAQDFYRLFAKDYKLGSKETEISNIDVRGITLVATKAVAQKTILLEKENAELKARVEDLEAKLEKVLDLLEK